MKVFGQLEYAQIHNLGSLPAAGIKGKAIHLTTDNRVYLDDGTVWRPILRNDGKIIIGNSGTATDNSRLHRGAAGLLQVLKGNDNTAEGTLSANLNQISARMENYTNAGKPAFGNPGRIIYVTDLFVTQLDTGSAWQTITPPTPATPLYDIIVGPGQTYTTLTAGLAALSADQSMFILAATYTENITVSVKANIYGAGSGAIINGTITFAAGSSDSTLRNVQVLDTVTINSGVGGITWVESELAAGKNLIDNSSLKQFVNIMKG